MNQNNNVDKIFEESKSVSEYAKKYLEYLSSLLTKLDTKAIEKVTQIFIETRNKGKKVLVIGNGGSAATASHFSNDFAIGTRCAKKPFKFLSLTDNNASMTAIANDFGYEQLFVKQMEVFMEDGDVVLAISASGNSGNIIAALEFAKSRKNTTIGLIGFDGGKMKTICDHIIHIETPKGEFGPVEDIHMILDHLMSNYVMRMVRQEN